MIQFRINFGSNFELAAQMKNCQLRAALSLLHFHYDFQLKLQLARICRILLASGSELSRAPLLFLSFDPLSVGL